MKKFAAILLICILFAPSAARLVIYMECTLQTDSGNDCGCRISSIPVDQAASFPAKQKEILEKTDVKYLLSQNDNCLPPLMAEHSFSLYQSSLYTYTLLSGIFHPPALS
ncbi:MAG TPA: hypothetical protein VHB48_15850 [Chitinophagaceae bacterium]|nr:hypothetical protein [Chitinophagaceae bacterium]